jgi:single-stranded DNA-binding protein
MAKIILLGTMGADAKVSVIGEGRNAINFSVCENVPVKVDKEVIYQAQWYNVSYFSSSDKMAKHLLKGKKVFISGTLRFSEFRNETTKQVMKTNEIVADTVEPVEWVKSEETLPNNELPPLPDNEL